jgi:hypothetical protein
MCLLLFFFFVASVVYRRNIGIENKSKYSSSIVLNLNLAHTRDIFGSHTRYLNLSLGIEFILNLIFWTLVVFDFDLSIFDSDFVLDYNGRSWDASSVKNDKISCTDYYRVPKRPFTELLKSIQRTVSCRIAYLTRLRCYIRSKFKNTIRYPDFLLVFFSIVSISCNGHCNCNCTMIF